MAIDYLEGLPLEKSAELQPDEGPGFGRLVCTAHQSVGGFSLGLMDDWDEIAKAWRRHIIAEHDVPDPAKRRMFR
jgi:hypothetical protein